MHLTHRSVATRAACPLILMAAALIYCVCWSGSLVWDDHYLIDGTGIGGGASLRDCITHPFLDHYFRPLVAISFFFERRLWVRHALGYHLTNTLLHVLATGAFMGLLQDAFGRRRIALIGGILFALQPAQVGAIAWIGGRTDALCMLWMILFAWALIRAVRSTGDRRSVLLALSVAAYTAALFTKEQALAALPLVPLAFRCWGPRRGRDLPRTEWWAALPFAVSCALFLAMGLLLGMPRPYAIAVGLPAALAQSSRIATYYTLVLLAPTPRWMHTLSLGALERAGIWPIALGAGSAAVAAVLLYCWRRAEPAAAWFLALIVLSLLPVCGLVPLPFLLVAPYRACLAGIGVAALMGWGLDRLWTAAARRRQHRSRSPDPGSRSRSVVGRRWSILAYPQVVLVLLVCWHAGLTAWGAAQWRDEEKVFRQIVRWDPDSIVAHFVLAWILSDKHRDAEAGRQVEAVLQLLYRSAAWQSRESAAKALAIDPQIFARTRQNQGTNRPPREWLASLYATLGSARLRAGHPAQALDAYRIGEAIRPEDAAINIGLGYCAGASGDPVEAVRRMRLALRDCPGCAYPHDFLAHDAMRRGDWSTARTECAAWLAAAPTSEEARLALADAQAHLRDPTLDHR